MGLKERRERERDEVRTKIMDAARDLFAKEGIEAVSMRKIAEAVEYSPTAIYQHFLDKESLLREICKEDFGNLAGTLNEIAREDDPIKRIEQIGLAYCRFGVAYPNHYRLMFMTPFTKKLDEEEECGKGNPDEDAYAFVKHAVTQGIESGRFREDLTDPDLVTQILWAGVHGMVSLQITKEKDPWLEWSPLEERFAQMTKTLVRGLIRHPAKEFK
jgi:AcrR family transcriptional regulator